MTTIWKFPLPVDDVVKVQMPKGARLLSVQVQGEMPCLWAVVEPHAPLCVRTIAVHGTGHEIQNRFHRAFSAPFVGTFQLLGGSLVFHVFDLGEARQ